MYPDVVRPIYFLSDREDSQAYHLKWRKLILIGKSSVRLG